MNAWFERQEKLDNGRHYQIAKTKTRLDDALHKVLLRERVSAADRLLQQTRQHHLAMGVVNTNELLCG